MRNRTLDSSIPLDAPTSLQTTASLQTTDHWFITEKGLRASGAASMMASAASLRQAAKELEEAASRLNQDMPVPPNGSSITTPEDVPHTIDLRRGTVCGRFRHNARVPDLRLCGKWLRNAGFELGQKYQVQVSNGQLMICAV